MSQPAVSPPDAATRRRKRAQALGGRIRRFRIDRKLDQTQLAAILGVVPSCVCDWERGHTSPKITRLVEIAKALDVDVNDLIRGA